MAVWYLSYDGKKVGPLGHAEAVQMATKNRNGFAWREGFAEWMMITQVGELSGTGSLAAPPPLQQPGADRIDFKILGHEMQFVELELDPGESAIAEAGAMMYKDSTIQMESIFGDGSTSSGASGGQFVNKLLSAGKRVITGESLFITAFTQSGPGKGKVAFAAPYPGNIVPVPLPAVGGTLICQKDSFLCAAKGVSIGLFFQKKILTALFGGEGFIMQKLEGDGLVFMHAGGTVIERELRAGETIDVDTGCIVGLQPTVQFDIRQAGNIKTLLFSGEGFFFATLKGPGKVWLQSLPFSRFAGRMMAGLSRRKEEGSALGTFGAILQGDRS